MCGVASNMPEPQHGGGGTEVCALTPAVLIQRRMVLPICPGLLPRPYGFPRVKAKPSLIRPCEESFDRREELPGLLGMWVVAGVGNHHEPRMNQHADPLFAAGKG
jgi:hypothetical protein